MKKLSKFSTNNVVRFNAEYEDEPKNFVGCIEIIKVTEDKKFQYFIRDAYDILWCIPEQYIEFIAETPPTFINSIDSTIKYELINCFELINDKPKIDLYSILSKPYPLPLKPF